MNSVYFRVLVPHLQIGLMTVFHRVVLKTEQSKLHITAWAQVRPVTLVSLMWGHSRAGMCGLTALTPLGSGAQCPTRPLHKLLAHALCHCL